jgi:riboflavin synthase
MVDLDLALGDSIAVNGVCSTVVRFDQGSFEVNYLKETCDKSSVLSLKEGNKVNIEPSLRVGSKMGGHFVTGHVDAVGTIVLLEKKSPWGTLKVSFPGVLRPYFVMKGSVCLDGISLTISSLDDACLTCQLIPHTIEQTTLSFKSAGDLVNIECDMLGKYVLNGAGGQVER